MKTNGGLFNVTGRMSFRLFLRQGGSSFSLFLLALLLPALFAGSVHAAAMVSAGSYHTLAVTGGGMVRAWGGNTHGQLGNGGMSDSETPVTVSGLNNVTAVAAGGRHSVALKADGTVWTWGDNRFGQLGDGTTTNSKVPVQVVGLKDVAAVSAGPSHTLALKKDGTVWTWGANVEKKISDVAPDYMATPVQVAGVTDVTAILATSGLSIAVKKDGMVWVWGWEWWWGSRGDVTRTPRQVDIPGFSDVKVIAAGDPGAAFLLLLKRDGTVWGVGHLGRGVLGNGTVDAWERVPVQVPGLANVVAIAAGDGHAGAITSDGSVWVWGDNRAGQAGPKAEGFFSAKPTPVGIADAVAITAGIASSSGKDYALGETAPWGEPGVPGGLWITVLRNDGSIWSWGANNYGQFGNGTTSYNSSVAPVEASQLADVKSVSARGNHTVALKVDGTVWAWGYNEYGQVGDGTTNWTITPAQTKGLADVTAIAAGSAHSLALKNDGTVWAWGNNSDGQLGTGNFNYSSIPVQVTALADVDAIAAGYSHSVALKRDRTVWAWGNGEKGQVGNVAFTYRSSTPVPVTGLTDIVAVAAGNYQNLALKADGTVWRWGSCSPYPDTSVPVIISGIDTVMAIAAGAHHGVALKKDGTVWSWGNNEYGALGNGTYGTYSNAYSTVPVQAVGLSDVTAISAGVFYTMALRSDGTPWVWGRSNYGTAWNWPDGVRFGAHPMPMTQLWDIAAIAGGDFHAAAIKRDGTVWGWGRNDYSQLGNGFDRRIPQKALVFTLFNAERTQVGVFNGGQWYLDGNGNGTWDQRSDGVYAPKPFGIAGDIPVTGSWRSGRTRMGVFRQGAWFLDMNRSGWEDGIDASYSFGIPSDIPVTGKWSGGLAANINVLDSKIGVFRDGAWYLDINGNGAWDEGDVTYSFGIAGDVPVTGDWNGNGTTKIGVVRGNTWFLDMNGNGAWDDGIDAGFSFGIPGDVPVTGDWNGSGTTKIGVVRGGSDWYLDINGNGGWDDAVDRVLYGFGIPGDVPVTGNW